MMRASDATMSGARQAARGSLLFLLSFALLKFLIHVLVGPGYGWFRDELYYVECSERLAWGYVDHPPLSIALLRLERSFLGDSLRAVRLLPALAGAATVFLAGWMSRRMGGGRFAQALAMTSTLAAPVLLGIDGIYSMNGLDVLFWALAAAVLIGILQSEDWRGWAALGAVLGLGLLNKISVLWLGFGLLAGLLLTPQRRWLRTRWPWIGGGIALAIFLPHLVWQALHGWPTLEFMRNAARFKMIAVSPLRLLGDQVLAMHPLTLPVWGSGLALLLFSGEGRRLRPLGWMFVAVLLLLMASGTSRPTYLAPAFTILFAAGGVAIERLSTGRAGLRARPAVLAVLALGGAILAPLALPVLPVGAYLRYASLLGVRPMTQERIDLEGLPQHFADMNGWEAFVASVAEVYERLPPAERKVAGIFAQNYGEAGALNVLGRAHGLPRAVSGHNNYWLWGPGEYSGEVMIIVGGEEGDNRRVCGSLERAGTTHCGYCIPYENHLPIYVCRGLSVPVADLWPQLKRFI